MNHLHKSKQRIEAIFTFIFSFCIFITPGCNSTEESKPQKLKGIWKVVSIESAAVNQLDSVSLKIYKQQMSPFLEKATVEIRNDSLFFHNLNGDEKGKILVDKSGEFFGYYPQTGGVSSCRLYKNHSEFVLKMNNMTDSLTIMLKSI